jgi:trigger factor
MSVIVAIEEAGPSRKRLKVSVPADEVETETRAVVGELGRSARVPGFRRGKVPASVVRQRYRETIEREVVDRLLPRAWRQAEEEGGLSPLAPPRVEEVGPLAEGEPLTFSATVEVRPPIRLGAAEIEGADGFELPDPPVEPTDQEVADALDDLRRRVAGWVPADRPAARGDRVRASITEIAPEGSPGRSVEEPAETPAEPAEPAESAEPAEPPEPQEAVVEIGDPRVWEELTLALTGLAAGQEGRFTRRPEGDAAARSFRVRVEAVEERDLPPLDDEFARKIGQYDDVETLRREVVAGLTAKKRADRGQERRRALMQQLRARHPVELPRGVVDHDIEHLLADYANELGRRGVDPERAQLDWQGLAAQVRPEAERRVHDRLLLDAAAEELGIEIGEADLTAALAVLARAHSQSAAELRRGLAESGRLDGLREQLRRDRALTRLLGEDSEEGGGAAATVSDGAGTT